MFRRDFVFGIGFQGISHWNLWHFPSFFFSPCKNTLFPILSPEVL